MDNTSYAYAVGNIKAREHTLLKKNDIELLLNSKDMNTFQNILIDKGYAIPNVGCDTDEIIASEERKLWDYIYSVAPDREILKVFTVSNDFHNIKAVLKGTIRSKAFSGMLLYPSEISEDVLKKAIEEKKFYLLPDSMSEALKLAYEVFTKTKDVQISDGILDKACMQEQLRLAKESKSQFLWEYFSALVFYNDVKIALRAANAGKGSDFLDDTLCPTDNINIDALKNAVLISRDSVLEYVSKLNVFDSKSAVESFKVSPSEFEKTVDDILMSVVREAKYISLGIEPVACFIFAKNTELLLVKLIAFGIRVGLPVEEIRERLRMLYE